MTQFGSLRNTSRMRNPIHSGAMRRVSMFPIGRASHVRSVQTSSPWQAGKASSDEAIKFSASAASKWRARKTFQNNRNSPWYEPLVVSGSLMVMMAYFCVLREESDVDEALGRNLYDHLPHMEEHQLKVTLEYQKMHGQDTSAVQSRLDQIRGR